ncbi:MAG: hypothetical protein CL793_01315 [Chloroflexi bacterium]|nr:hypothetical protein [Chloroflexota bacterium]|tara:strand:- start:8546 stop:9499 length:954 start_codon:yes stop_codon:yes gene_type:complete
MAENKYRSTYELGIQIKANIEKIITGVGDSVELVIAVLFSKGHVLIEDLPGTGKTTLARTLAATLDCSFGRIQFTPDLMPSDITGLYFYNQKSSEFEFHRGPIFGQVILADEINRATPRTQSALLEAMQEQQVTVEGVTWKLPEPFMVIATQNPLELEGTFPLPEAQLDRFMVRCSLGYPSFESELHVLNSVASELALASVHPIATAEDLIQAQEHVNQVEVEETVSRYLLEIVRTTRAYDGIEIGASTRSALALHRLSQAIAIVNDRDFVIPDDVKKAAPSVLAHRLLLDAQGRMTGGSGVEVVQNILTEIPVPVR